MEYEWKPFPTGTQPGKFIQPTPPTVDITVKSNALNKVASGNYDRAKQLLTWNVTLNRYAIGMDTIAFEDTFGKQQQLYAAESTGTVKTAIDEVNAATSDVSETITISSDNSADIAKLLNATAQSGFLTAAEAESYLTSITYSYSTIDGYKLTAVCKDALNAKMVQFRYQTKVIDETIVAGNVLTGTTVPTISNTAKMDYKKEGNSATSTSTASNKVPSQVITKTGVGYDYSDESINWKIVVNQNKMVLSKADYDTYVYDIIENETTAIQDLVKADGTLLFPIKITSTDTAKWGSGITINTLSTTVPTDGSPYATYDNATRKLTIHFGSDWINNQSVTIVYKTKLTNKDTFFEGGKKTTGTVNNTATLHSIYPEQSADATIEIKNKMLTKVGKQSADGSYAANSDPVIRYEIGINPLKITLPNTTVIEDVLPAGIDLDTTSFELYEATVGNSVSTLGNTNTSTTEQTGSNLISNCTLGFGTVTGADSKPHTTFRLDLNFNHASWGSGASSKSYILKYKMIITDPTITSVINSVKLADTEYASQDTTSTNSYSADSRRISGLASSYGSITFTKVDATNTAHGVPGAVFEIENAYGQKSQATSDTSGIVRFTMLVPGGVYTIREISAAPGYVDEALTVVSGLHVGSSGTANVTVTNGVPVGYTNYKRAITLTNPVLNTAQPWVVSFTKQDQYGRGVVGAEFALYLASADDTIDANILQTATSNSLGVVQFDLSATTLQNKAYKFKEISAPSSITFDPATAPLYYFTFHNGTLSRNGIFDNSGLTGNKVTTITNQSNVPPPTPDKPNTPDEPGTPDGGTYDPEDPDTPTIVKMKASPSPTPATGTSIDDENGESGDDNGVNGKNRLPKTGGFFGTIFMVALGIAFISIGVYLRFGKLNKKKKDK